MEKDNKRPNAALINREWYESAREVLTREELGSAVLNAIAYVLYGDELPPSTSKVGIVCRMIKPALDSDLDKYQVRCARNAINAKSQRQRVGASGSEWERVGANTTTTTTTTSTTTTKPSISDEEQIKREKWLIYGYFWSTGSNAIEQECSAFWSYYESLGWKNNKGAVIVNKLAAARMWRRQFETKAVPDGAPVWYAVIKECEICDYSLYSAYLGAERVEDKVIVRLRVSEQWLSDFRERCGHLLTALAKAWRVQEIDLVKA